MTPSVLLWPLRDVAYHRDRAGTGFEYVMRMVPSLSISCRPISFPNASTSVAVDGYTE
jgi:hypothetical protein